MTSGRAIEARRGAPPEFPTFSHALHRWFSRYLSYYFGRHFTAVRLSKSGPAPAIDDRPLVFYSNHPSWWDPVLYMLVGRLCYPGREGYGPMDAAAIGKYGFFKKLGVFGVEPGTLAGAREFLRVSAGVLERPGSTLWLTAEGEFKDARRRPIRLKSGLAHLVRRLDSVAVVPLAIEYTFWNERLPEALLSFGEPILKTAGDPDKSAGEWNQELERRLEETLDRLAAVAGDRDPERFEVLSLGRTGVGGLYDRWRRVKALLRGESFDAAHGVDSLTSRRR